MTSFGGRPKHLPKVVDWPWCEVKKQHTVLYQQQDRDEAHCLPADPQAIIRTTVRTVRLCGRAARRRPSLLHHLDDGKSTVCTEGQGHPMPQGKRGDLSSALAALLPPSRDGSTPSGPGNRRHPIRSMPAQERAAPTCRNAAVRKGLWSSSVLPTTLRPR